jgi:hypothetical protein
MNVYNPLDSMRRLEAAGLDRRQAEAIADEINVGNSDLVTKDYFKEQLDAEFSRFTVRLGGLIAGMIALATAVLGVIISIK